MVDFRHRPARPDPLLHARSGCSQPGTRDRQPRAQGREGDRGRKGRRERQGHGEEPRQVCRCAEVPLRRDRGRRSGRCCDRPGVDRGRRRTADRRGHPGPRQGQDVDHRQAGRRHAGIGTGGERLCSCPGCPVRDRAAAVRAARYPRPRARRCGSQGRSVGRRGDDYLDGFGVDPKTRSARMWR